MPVVDDRGDGAGGGDQGDHGGVEVPGGLDLRVEVLPDRADLDDVAEQETGHVEVVDGHVPEDAAGLGDIAGGRRGRIPADDRDLLHGADLAGRGAGLNLGKPGVEAAVEPDHHGGRALAEGGDAVIHAGQVQVDRLLAHDLLARRIGGQNVLDVQRRRGPDDHRIDGVVGPDVVDIQGGPGAVRRGQPRRPLPERVGDEREPGAGVRGDGGGVDRTDPTGADDGDVEHALSLACRGGVPSGPGALAARPRRRSKRSGSPRPGPGGPPGRTRWRPWRRRGPRARRRRCTGSAYRPARRRRRRPAPRRSRAGSAPGS